VAEQLQDARAAYTADLKQSLNVESTSVESTPVPIDLAIASPSSGKLAEVLPQSSAPHSSNAIQANEAGALDSKSLTENFDPQSPTARVERQESSGVVSASQESDQLTQAERVRLVQRVARSFARLGPMGGQINIRLHPPQLGSLNVQVRMEGRTMTAKLTTESTAARDAILESLPVLRGRLSEQGFEIASFQVEVADNNSDAASGQFQSGTEHSDGSDGQRAGHASPGTRPTDGPYRPRRFERI
jgi:flagellar hook-length control protein FliK